MEINYRMDQDLDWNNAETVEIEPEGWKKINVKFISADPIVFWRINDIPHNFTSNSEVLIQKGVSETFCSTLKSLKILIKTTMDKMPEERKKFYKENILELFNE